MKLTNDQYLQLLGDKEIQIHSLKLQVMQLQEVLQLLQKEEKGEDEKES